MSEISLQGLGLFSDESDRQSFAAGQVIVRAGDPADTMYVVAEGELAVTLEGQELDRLTAGELFGEMGMVENRPRSATVTAITDCCLIPIDKMRFAALVRQHPGFATRVMAIMSSRLRRQMSKEVVRQAFKRELEIGRQMQLALLPAGPPEIPGWSFASYYEAAWQVGGDFFDFIRPDDDPDRLRLVIADVTGKGVPAALFMAVARTMIRAETEQGRSPSEVLTRVNRMILCDERSPLFLSALYAELDLASGRLRYASAGHDRPLCLRRATGRVEELPAAGFLLGAFSDATFDLGETILNEGDALVLYTDGISEARDGQRHFFGLERLQAAMFASGVCEAQHMVDGIVGAVREFAGDVDQEDDLTLLVVKRG
ncbi:MAG: SpoIIE family protein phosphatase [Chloroflexota bacterium]|jgi:sigma-B regulation protein RsbU (phosphoserine phosphatase)